MNNESIDKVAKTTMEVVKKTLELISESKLDLEETYQLLALLPVDFIKMISQFFHSTVEKTYINYLDLVKAACNQLIKDEVKDE